MSKIHSDIWTGEQIATLRDAAARETAARRQELTTNHTTPRAITMDCDEEARAKLVAGVMLEHFADMPDASNFRQWAHTIATEVAKRAARAEREAMAKQEPCAYLKTSSISGERTLSFDDECKSQKLQPLFASPVPIPEGWQLMDMGWLRQMMHVNFLKCHPDKSHEAIAYEIDRVLAAAPKHPTSTEGGAGDEAVIAAKSGY